MEANATYPAQPHQPVWGLSARGFCLLVATILAVAYSVQIHDTYRIGLDIDIQERKTEGLGKLSESEKNVAAGSIRKKAAFAVIALTAFGLIARSAFRGTFQWSDAMLLGGAYVGFAVMSVSWSIASTMTTRELIRLLVTAFLAAGLALNFSKRDVVRVAMAITACSLLYGFLLEVVLGGFRPWESDYRFAGGIHSNTIGLHAAVLAIGAVATLTESKYSRWAWFCLLLALASIVLAKSRTSLACAMLGAFVAVNMAYGVRRLALSWSGGACLASFGVLWLALFGSSAQDGVASAASMGREQHSGLLTGRIPIWTECAEYIKDRPLFGHGYKSFWIESNTLDVAEQINFIAANSHSAYVEVLLQLGGIGLLMLISMAAMIAWRHSKWSVGDEQRVARGFFCGLIALAVIHGTMETAVSEAWVTGMLLATSLLLVGRPLVLISDARSIVVAPSSPHASLG